MRFRRPAWGLLLIIGMCWYSCAPTSPDTQQQAKDVQRLARQIRQNPENDQAYSDLGALLFESGRTQYASKSLMRAYKLNPKNAQTLYFLGQILEARNEFRKALEIYGKYRIAGTPQAYNARLQGRYLVLRKRMLRSEYHRMLQDESALETKQTLPNGVAVLPFHYIGMNAEEFGPVGKGLAEMVMTDLSQIKRLKVVERVRVQTLLDEINLTQTGLLDESTSPKFGKMLGAAKLVQGNFTIDPKKRVQMDVSYADVMQRDIMEPVVLGDHIDNLFKLEKDLVFKIVDQMGIRLTPQERENIQRIPTSSIQAFMAYCMGLEMEDRENFSQAAAYFQQALQIDPGYAQARTRVRSSRSIAQAHRPAQMAPVPGDRTMDRPEAGMRQEMIDNRLQVVNRNIGATFLPGTDSRKSSEEAIGSVSGEGEIEDIKSVFESLSYEDLPTPPPPPNP